MSRLQSTIENLALRLAADRGGRVTPTELMPYLPLSLGMIERSLEAMVDNSIVFAQEEDGQKVFEFPELLDAPRQPFPEDECLSCDCRLDDSRVTPLCVNCARQIGREALDLAETEAWPAEAVWQHELLYIASASGGAPIRVAEVAGRSRLPLKRVKARLAELARRGWAREVVDEPHGVLTYRFPPMRYDDDAFQQHDRFIRRHPSSVREELEIKTIRALSALLAVALACLGLALLRAPFRLVIVLGLIAAALIVAGVYLRRTPVRPE